MNMPTGMPVGGLETRRLASRHDSVSYVKYYLAEVTYLRGEDVYTSN